MAELELLKELEDWYFAHGCKRGEETDDPKFLFDPNDWPNLLVHSRRELQAVEEAMTSRRPALAIWGPSQTGKSALFTQDIDRHTLKDPENLEESGKFSGFYWTGGKPYCFDNFVWNPDMNTNIREDALFDKAFNPVGIGRDATAVMCRFTAGVLPSEEGEHCDESYRLVDDPLFPVRIRICDRKDILMFLAAGFASQSVDGQARTGNSDIDGWGDWEPVDPTEDVPRKEAFEWLNDLADILEIFLSAGKPRYAGLRGKIKHDTDNRLRFTGLFNSLYVTDVEKAQEFVFSVLWNGEEKVTAFFHKMMAMASDYAAAKTELRCSLSAASMLVNMNMSLLAFVTPDTLANHELHRHSRERITKLRFADRNFEGRQVIVIGMEEEFSESADLLSSPFSRGEGIDGERLCLFQSIILEMIVPLNPEYLTVSRIGEQPEVPSTLGNLLSCSDLLDFPGVAPAVAIGNIDFDDDDPDPGNYCEVNLAIVDGNDRNVGYSVPRFFFQLVKRGKTEATFLSYSSRRLIDGMVVIQSLTNMFAAAVPESGQVVTGYQHLSKCLGNHINSDNHVPLFLLFSIIGSTLNLDLAMPGMNPIQARLNTCRGFYNGLPVHETLFYNPHFNVGEYAFPGGYVAPGSDTEGMVLARFQNQVPELFSPDGEDSLAKRSLTAVCFAASSDRGGQTRLDTGFLYSGDEKIRTKADENAGCFGDGGTGFVFAALEEALSKARRRDQALRIALLEEKRNEIVGARLEQLLTRENLLNAPPKVTSWQRQVESVKSGLVDVLNEHIDGLENASARDRADKETRLCELLNCIRALFSVAPNCLIDPCVMRLPGAEWLREQFSNAWAKNTGVHLRGILKATDLQAADFEGVADAVCVDAVLERLTNQLHGMIRQVRERNERPDLRRLLALWMTRELQGSALFSLRIGTEQVNAKASRLDFGKSFRDILEKRLVVLSGAEGVVSKERKLQLGVPELIPILEGYRNLPAETADALERLKQHRDSGSSD